MRQRRIVLVGKSKLIKSNKDYEGWLAGSGVNEDSETKECAKANPDTVSEEDAFSYERGENRLRAMKLMEEGIQLLTDRQREVYKSYYYDYKTEHEIGDDLGITQSSVSALLKRAVTSITKHCHQRALELGMGDEKYD